MLQRAASLLQSAGAQHSVSCVKLKSVSLMGVRSTQVPCLAWWSRVRQTYVIIEIMKVSRTGELHIWQVIHSLIIVTRLLIHFHQLSTLAPNDVTKSPNKKKSPTVGFIKFFFFNTVRINAKLPASSIFRPPVTLVDLICFEKRQQTTQGRFSCCALVTGL